MSAPVTVRLTPVVPSLPKRAVTLLLTGTPEVSGAAGGWSPVERPMRSAAAEWLGLPELLQTIPVALDGRDEAQSATQFRVVERLCRVVEGWAVPTEETGAPPVFKLAGPVLYTDRRWVIDDLAIGDCVRNEDGRRISQDYAITLREYVAPKVLGPAVRHRKKKPKKPPKSKGKKP